MKRDSVIVYRSWLKGVQRLSIEKQNGLIRLAIDYGLDGVIPEEEGLDPFTDMFLQMVIPQINANNKKYQNGLNGGAPKGNRNNPNGRGGKRTNQELTKKQPRTNQELTENQRNDNVNVNANANDNVFIKESKRKKVTQPMTEEEKSFIDGMTITYPRVMKMPEPLTLSQYQTIASEYGPDAVKCKLEEMENWESLTKKHSANLTLRNWLRRNK